MANSKPFVAFCLGIMALGLLAHGTEAKYKGINQFCKTSDYRSICNLMVQNATNWHDATKNAIQYSLRTATVLQKMTPIIEQALSKVPPKSKEDAVKTCKDSVDGAVENLQQALGYLNSNDIGSLNTYLSAAVGTDDCADAFSQFGAVLPPIVAKTSDHLSKQVSNCLAVSQQI